MIIDICFKKSLYAVAGGECWCKFVDELDEYDLAPIYVTVAADSFFSCMSACCEIKGCNYWFIEDKAGTGANNIFLPCFT